jgi:hypothetical protein
MMRSILVGCVALFLSLGAIFAVTAQDSATPTGGTPTEETLCATPLGEAIGMATPELVVSAPTTAASPGGSDPGTPIGLFPCGTPLG